jgi:hypothetical protein
MTHLEQAFPNLIPGEYRGTSPADANYNCIAWAAGETDRWWWPDAAGVSYWPSGVPREETLDAFLAAFATLGYAPTGDPSLEPDTEKVAIFANSGVPTHAVRQLPHGRWTSKLGQSEDIEHLLNGLTGGIYGRVALILKRPTTRS